MDIMDITNPSTNLVLHNKNHLLRHKPLLLIMRYNSNFEFNYRYQQ
jgi:hypothetical protein